jgi:hypothetical protein
MNVYWPFGGASFLYIKVRRFKISSMKGKYKDLDINFDVWIFRDICKQFRNRQTYGITLMWNTMLNLGLMKNHEY